MYNILIQLYGFAIRIVSFKNKKAKKWIQGRYNWKRKVSSNHKNEKSAWFHCASLGEYDQAKPLIARIDDDYKVIVTFFSPSGYESYEQNDKVDYVYYLPLDTKSNAKSFISMINPTLVFFVKYELWYNYLSQLFSRSIPTYLIAANFRKNQFIFRWYGKLIRDLLPQFDKIFVQYNSSKELLNSKGILNVVVAGDTRFENVVKNCELAADYKIVETFKDNKTLIVGGSSWPIEENIMFELAKRNDAIKLVYAPHDISKQNIERLSKQLINSITYSKLIDCNNTARYQSLIIDNVGLLKSLYKYADIALVGGGFSNKLHNILEPAVFAVPVVFGSNNLKYPEAKAMVLSEGALEGDVKDLKLSLHKLISNENLRVSMGEKSKHFVLSHLGATNIILKEIKKES